MLPCSTAPGAFACRSGGRSPGCSPLATATPVRPRGRASRARVTRAYAERRMRTENARLKSMNKEEQEATIRNQFQRVNLSPSSYDTAWVAMVPLQDSSQAPHFPQCVEWILQNQHDNGSWGMNQINSSINKGILLSTLACVLALKKWNVGTEHITRGLNFIGRNFSIVMDEQIVAPIGFDIIFPGMLSIAIGMGLQLPVRQTNLDGVLHLRDMELKREARDNSYGKQAYMAYCAEGLGNLLEWNEIMKFQRKNGSLFNCPSTTAAALVHNYDDRALQYLNLLVSKFGGAVPAVYPLNIYYQLSMVDVLEKTGISQHFASEIKSILDMTYSCWLQRDEEIMLDITTCAMAFRLLRMNGYDVSSVELSHVADASTFRDSLQGYLKDTKSILELYKASKVSIEENEFILDNIDSWSGNLLKDKLCSNGVPRTPIFREIEHTLKFPFHATLERLEHKRNIEDFDDNGFHLLKTGYLPFYAIQDLQALAVEDFSTSQSIYQDELKQLDSWAKDCRLEELEFARKPLRFCFLSAAATIFPPELSDARMSWTKQALLTSIVDDLFDAGGSQEELENLTALVEKWDGHHEDEFCSKQVKIVFDAIYTTVNQLAAKASEIQGRDVTEHHIEMWQEMVRTMVTEAEWQRSQYVPTVEEYIPIAVVSFALGPIVPLTMYFVGPKISDRVVKDDEHNELFRLSSTCGRLLNDIQTFERERGQGKLNSVLLLVHHSGGSMSIEAAKKEIQKSIDTSRRELLRLVLKEESVVPRLCKELYWKMCKTLHLFYFQTDGFTSPKEMMSAANAVISEPLKLQATDPSSSISSKKLATAVP